MARAVLGSSARVITHQPFGHNSVTFDVALVDGRRVIVRTNADPAVFAATEHNLSVLADLGFPVPRVLAADLSQTRWPFAYLILPRLPGRDLRYELAAMTPDQMTRLAAQIVGFQRTVGDALSPGRGFGYVGIGERGPFTSWWEMLAPPENGVADARKAAYHRCVRVFEPYLRSVAPTCFLDDVTVKNVLVEHGELRGLVDFDCVCYGDPLYWLALTAVGVVSDVGTRELFYANELARFYGVTDAERPVLALYAAGMAADFLGWYAAASETTGWNRRMEAAFDRWLADAH